MKDHNSFFSVLFGTLEVMVQWKERSYLKSHKPLMISLPATATIKSNKWLLVLAPEQNLGITHSAMLLSVAS